MTELNLYAPPFVRQALKQVNLTQAIIVPSSPPAAIDYATYISTFTGSCFVESKKSTDLHASPAADNWEADQPLSPANYAPVLHSILDKEGAALQLERDEHAMYDVPIAPASSDQPLYSLHMPGLRESVLRFDVGDIVHIRQLRFGPHGEDIIAPSYNYYRTGDPHIDSVGANTQYDAVIWRIDRATERLFLRIDALIGYSFRFNVRFSVQAHRLSEMRAAVDSPSLGVNAASNSWTRSMLFPEAADGVMQRTLNSITSRAAVFDNSLNYEQTRAVATARAKNYGAIPYLISGPPGTGKTKTVVELALQTVQYEPEAHVLLCAPSDSAADTLVARLSARLTPKQMLRLNASSRNFAEVPSSILSFCHIEDDIFCLPAFPLLMAMKVVVVACSDASMLVKARLTNQDIYALETRFHAALHPDTPMEPALHWTLLILDEAAQAMEPEALIPLQVMAPPISYDPQRSALPAIVMAGDQHQLGPRTASKEPGAQCSLFERLLRRPLYSEHPLARSKLAGGVVKPLTAAQLPILRPPFMNLIRNYRSHAAILAVPSSLFYNDTLEPTAKDVTSLLRWTGFVNGRCPVLFSINRESDEVDNLDRGGWYNDGEVMQALYFARSFLQERLLEQHEICIMSPFSAQVRKLRLKARSKMFKMHQVNIGPLEAFQGLESRLVILCTTRTRDRFIDQDIARGLGVIHEPRRLNVALTRAKEGLIVIGNPAVLGQDEDWANFIAFCKRHRALEGEELAEDKKWSQILLGKVKSSRLEKQLQPASAIDDGLPSFGRLQLGNDMESQAWQDGVEAEQYLQTAVQDPHDVDDEEM